MTDRTCHAERRPGFTLLEVLVTLCIVASLTAACVPAIVAWSRNMELTLATKSMCVRLKTAQRRAVTESKKYLLTVEDQAYRVTSSDRSYDRRYTLADGISVSLQGTENNIAKAFVLHADGRTSHDRITLTQGAKAASISASRLTGTITHHDLQ